MRTSEEPKEPGSSEARSLAAKKAALTRKWRRAAQKAALTRRRRAAARKAWETRRYEMMD